MVQNEGQQKLRKIKYTIENVHIRQHFAPTHTPIRCQICLKSIRKGQRYHYKIGYEAHRACVVKATQKDGYVYFYR